MGQKDNPRQTSRMKQIAVSIGVLLVLIGGIWGAHAVLNHLTEQEQLLLKYQDNLVEQGSLINQQEEQLLKQKETLTEVLVEVKGLQGTVKEQKAAAEKAKAEFDKQKKQLDSDNKALEGEKQSLQRKVEQLEKDLAFKKAKAKEAAVAAAQKKSSPPPTVTTASVTKTSVKAPAKAAAKTVQPSRGTAPAGRTISVSSTGYIAMCDTGCTGITATGIDLRNQPHLKVIAVDPRVIPLGTKVYVPGYGYAIAGDTGGAIKGNKIDIHFPTRQDAISWGRRTIQITILD